MFLLLVGCILDTVVLRRMRQRDPCGCPSPYQGILEVRSIFIRTLKIFCLFSLSLSQWTLSGATWHEKIQDSNYLLLSQTLKRAVKM